MMHRDDRGSVAAEFAVVLPAVILVLALGMSALATGSRQVRLQDAAADAARLVARGEPEGRAADTVGGAVAGAGASISRRGDLVCVIASVDARVAGFISVPLSATSCALDGGL